MREVLDRRGTDFRIVVTPFYDQLALAPEDHQALEEIFGPGKVHDFMGRNEFSERMTDYYDASHYRPQVANAILDRVYRGVPTP